MSTHSEIPQQASRRRRRVLVGVTGSVAAVKSPLVALKISTELDAEVIVLLTRAGQTFWTKAETYDPCSWNEFLKRSKQRSNEVNFPPEREIVVYGEMRNVSIALLN